MAEFKKIWILNHYASTDYDDQGGRHYGIAKYLRREGYEPVIFCCNKIHNTNRFCFNNDNLVNELTDEATDVPYVFLRGRDYSGSGKKRVLNMLDFYRNLKKIAPAYAKKSGKPDIIYASSVHPLTLVAGIKLARRYGVKCICEVRDLWPESIVEYSDSLSKDNPIIKVLYAGEKWIYKKCDALIFTFENGYDYIRERGWTQAVPREKVFYVNNGVDLEIFNYNKDAYLIQDEDLEDDDRINIIYTGSIRKVNNLGRLLDIAKLIRNDKIRFLVWGDGDELEPLRKRLEDEKITNVVFKGKVDKKYIPYITSKAYINFAHNNPSKLFKYGISFNKIFDYMAAGRPILVDFECNSNPVINIGAEISTQGYTCEDIAHAIEAAAEMSGEKYRALCENSIKGAKRYDYKQLAKELINVINKAKTGRV